MPRRIPYHKPRGLPSASKQYERRASRQEDKNFYSGERWRSLRAAYLADNPLCEKCPAHSRALAEHVHHVLPRKPHPELAYDWANLEALCIPCHNAEKVR